ncbi:MAG: hypothetical protein JW785_06090 [Acidimicrobiia bacterium]|nr:hypothetical protein [Acidimicrobiia bacterium]
MNRTLPRFALLLAALALLLAACGDDDGSPFASVTTTAGGTTAGDGTTTSAGDGTTTTGAGDGTTTTAGDDEGDLPELLERYRTIPLRTTYLTGDGGTEAEITFSQDPTANPPVSAMISEDGKAIFLEDRMIFCSAGQCFEMPGEGGLDFIGAMFSPYALLALADEDLVGTPGFELESAPINIAGRTGTCFTFRPTAMMGTQTEYVRQCVDSELGFTLLLEAKETDGPVERVMELLAVGDPRPDDFEPTGPVTPMPTG